MMSSACLVRGYVVKGPMVKMVMVRGSIIGIKAFSSESQAPSSGFQAQMESQANEEHSKNDNSASQKSWAAQVNSSRPVRHRRSKDSAIIQTMKAIQKSEEEQLTGKEASGESIDPVFTRKFEAGMTYDPFDFSMAKARLEQKKRTKPVVVDKFKAAGVSPLELWKDPVGISSFLSPSGNILGSHLTGNSRKNQKLLSKAVKRAQRAGLLSKHSKAVEFLSTDAY